MPLDKKLITWENMDVEKIGRAYQEIKPKIDGEQADAKTRRKIKSLLQKALPEYKIKCNRENNPPKVVDSGNIVVRVSTKTYPDGSFNYIDIIF